MYRKQDRQSVRHRSTDLTKQVGKKEKKTAPRVSVPVVKYQQSNQSFSPHIFIKNNKQTNKKAKKKKKKKNNKKERKWT